MLVRAGNERGEEAKQGEEGGDERREERLRGR